MSRHSEPEAKNPYSRPQLPRRGSQRRRKEDAERRGGGPAEPPRDRTRPVADRPRALPLLWGAGHRDRASATAKASILASSTFRSTLMSTTM